MRLICGMKSFPGAQQEVSGPGQHQLTTEAQLGLAVPSL